MVSGQHLNKKTLESQFLLASGLSELYIDDIKARVDRTGDLNAHNACTVCLIVHQGILLVRSSLMSFL